MNTYDFSVLYKRVDLASTQTKISKLTKLVTPETKPQPEPEPKSTGGYL
jgi:hypothetical protein